MSKILFDFLTESFLFNEKLNIENYRSIDEKTLLQEISLYREHVLNKEQDIIEEINSHSSNLSLLFWLS